MRIAHRDDWTKSEVGTQRTQDAHPKRQQPLKRSTYRQQNNKCKDSSCKHIRTNTSRLNRQQHQTTWGTMVTNSKALLAVWLATTICIALFKINALLPTCDILLCATYNLLLLRMIRYLPHLTTSHLPFTPYDPTTCFVLVASSYLIPTVDY